MNHQPLISVCMPAYNAERYISAAITSVLEQSYRNFELIIVDDGSTDGTEALLRACTDLRVRVIRQDNRGQSAAANTAYQASTGELIKFMDADDLVSPEHLEKQVHRLQGRRNAVVSASWGRFYNDNLSTFRPGREEVWQDLTGDEWLVTSWSKGSSMMQCALWLIPRKILQRSGLWDESLSLINDLDFFTRVLLETEEVLFEPGAILYYRSGISGSLSDSKSLAAAESAFRSVKQATDNLSRRRHDKRAHLSCANTWQQLVYTLYPDFPDLAAAGQERIMFFGGSDIPYQTGGISGFLSLFLGWKTIKRLKQLQKKRH